MLDLCLQSVLSQDYEDMEIIVIDDNIICIEVQEVVGAPKVIPYRKLATVTTET